MTTETLPAMGDCTCGCPDGTNAHLENCECYLRYWEIDQLDRISLAYDQLTAADPRNAEILHPLIANIVSFEQSCSGHGMNSITDPGQVIRNHIRRNRE